VIIGVALILALIAQAVSSISVSRMVTIPLNRAIEIAQTVAAGRLDNVIEVQSSDEIGLLMQALKEMNDGLAQLVGKLESARILLLSLRTKLPRVTMIYRAAQNPKRRLYMKPQTPWRD